jgi:H+/Na+-translocating ferredoxin:NAD+ oxidoreductase subunit B
MFAGVLTLAGLALLLSAILIYTARLLPARDDDVAARVEALLPRIQCGQCGYPGCGPYARAIADGEAPINRCPPGGAATIRQLADLLARDPLPLDDSLGHANMDQVARIDEAVCIGCNHCARACPVDAIVGIPQMMHTVLTEHCTGCELCIAPCPVDCIDLVDRHA